jgi:hypothetical protein
MDVSAFKPSSVTGFLVSQIGYDARLPKRGLIRSTDASLADGAHFEARDVYNGKVFFSGEVFRWGEKWDSFWWVLDFTGLDRAGCYRLHVIKDGGDVMVSDPFRIGESLVWTETVYKVAYGQFEERARQARHGRGWKDCGSDWRECGSHTFALIGLCDLLQYGFYYLSHDQQRRLAEIIATGCDFLCELMDKAESAGYPCGAVAHEIPNHSLVLPGDVASTAMALGYASRLLFDHFPDKAGLYLKRASQAFGYFLGMEPWREGGFSCINRGIEEGYQPQGFMTRDLMMALWAGLQLYSSGQVSVRPKLNELLDKILSRQIGEENAEQGYWGHFWEFDDRHHSEKANTHHHVGHDTGAVMAGNVLPLVEFCQRFYDDPASERASRAACDFARHFALPACRANPFLLLPMGVFGREGLLDFCGPWHGMNVTYGYFASMAVRLAAFAGLPELLDAAVGNLQWICGLNAGVTAEALEGSLVWRETIPLGMALPFSQIVGVGRRSVGGWAGIPGTIVNGFCTNPQFTLQVTPCRENDGPWLFTDEDWIPHAGGFLSAVAVLRNHVNVSWNQKNL